MYRPSIWATVAASVLVSMVATKPALAADDPEIAAACPDPGHWDVTKPQGQTRVIDFDTDEGTSISLDIARNQRWLVFDLLGHIYRLLVEGGSAVNLTESSGVALNFHPRISPDGKTIAFISDRGGQENLWLMDADGAHPRSLFRDMNSAMVEPAWLPNGSGVIVTRRFKTIQGVIRTNNRLWVVKLDGTSKPLLDEPVRSGVPPSSTLVSSDELPDASRPQSAWASPTPDGREVYFGHSDFLGSNRQIRRVSLGTGQVQIVTQTGSVKLCCARAPFPLQLGEGAPEVSPDGRTLAFVRKIPGEIVRLGENSLDPATGLWLRDIATGQDRLLMHPLTPDFLNQHLSWQLRAANGYAWAHDGQSIVISEAGKIKRVWLKDGRIETIPFRARIHREISEMALRKVRLSDGAFAPRQVRWPTMRADGSVAYEAGGFIWIEEPKGAEALRVPLPPNAFGVTPAWSPDGTTLVYLTFDGAVGQIHTWNVKSRKERRIDLQEAAYFGLAWGPDGQTIFTFRWPRALDYEPEQAQWDLISMDVRTGRATTLLTNQRASRLNVFDRDRVSFMRPWSSESAATYNRLHSQTDPLDTGFEVVSLRANGSEPRIEAIIPGTAKGVSLAPDGSFAAIEQFQDVYLAPMPEARPAVFDLLHHAEATRDRRLSTDGGYYASWMGKRLIFASAADIRVVEPDGAVRSRTVRLRLTPDSASPPHNRLAIVNARILTMKTRKIIERGSIVVTGSRITCVGDCDVSGVDKVLDGSGKVVMPGMFDVHAHIHRGAEIGLLGPKRAEQSLMLAYGFTSVFDPADGVTWTLSVGDMTDSGAMLGPRTWTTLGTLTSSVAYQQNLRSIRSPEDAEDVGSLKARLGVPSLKDFRLCTRAQRQWVTTAALKHNQSVTAESGDMLWDVSMIMDGHTGWEHWFYNVPYYKDVTEFLGRAGATYSPTIWLTDFPEGGVMEYFFGKQDVLADSKLRHWYPRAQLVARRTYVKAPFNQYILPLVADGVARVKRAGGHAAVGGHGEFYGLGSQWDLWALATGLTPMEALEAATVDGARFIGVADDLGSLEVGKLADILVLDADPSVDIHNSDRLSFVIKGGIVYDPLTLDQIWPRRERYGAIPWKTIENTSPQVDAASKPLE